MYYPDEVIEEVRSKNDIVDVVSGYVKLTKKGANYFGLCPFHNEKSPSFSVSGPKQMYYCFGCGAGGNVFSFLQQYENMTFPEAVKALAERAGVRLPEAEYTEEAKKAQTRKQMLLEVLKEAAKYFYFQLRAPQGEVGMKYLTGRELSADTMNKWGLGYSNKTADDLFLYLRKKGYDADLIIEAGLATHDEQRGMHDKLWNRVMFPIQDINHRVIGFGGRVMGDGKPKYLNSPETPVFDKSRNLFGLNYARSSRKNQIILCEGYMDVITMHQAGFTQAVASLGTAFTSGQASLLHKYADEVLLAYDSDGAGTNAALRAIGILREVGLTGKVLHFDPHKDPDEFIKAEGPEAFQKRIDEAENSFLFEVRILERDYRLQDPESKTKFFREVARKLTETFRDDLERTNYIETLAAKYHIPAGDLRKMVGTYAAQEGMITVSEKPVKALGKKEDPAESLRKTQRMLITWLTDVPGLYERIGKYISADDFTDPLYKEVFEKLYPTDGSQPEAPAVIMSRYTEEDKQQELAALFQTRLETKQDRETREIALHDLIMAVKKNSFAYYSGRLGEDVDALSKVVAGKKALEELARTRISLEGLVS